MQATDRLSRQLQFVMEADRMKAILRKTYIADGTRRENDAEHSWHLALMAMLLAEYSAEGPLDLLKVLRLVLTHDLVKIGAGDTYAYDAAAHAGKEERDRAAARLLFTMLPADQEAELHSLWAEYEAGATPEARFASLLDRLQPLILNFVNRGRVWAEQGISLEQVLRRNEGIGSISPELGALAAELIREAAEQGFLRTAEEMAARQRGEPEGGMIFRPIVPEEAGIYWALRLEALRCDPVSFGSTYAESAGRSLDAVRAAMPTAEDHFILGAFTEEGSLAAMCGFRRESGLTSRHKGMIYSVYTSRPFRGQGLARRLLREVLDRAERLPELKQIQLMVVTTNAAALRLYGSLGFEVYGIEREALRHGEHYYDEALMAYMVPKQGRAAGGGAPC